MRSASARTTTAEPLPASSGDACSVSREQAVTVLSTQVTDATGAAVDRADLEVRCGATVVTALTGDDGVATLRLHPGIYRMTLRAPGFAEKTIPVEVPQSAPMAVRMEVGSATDTVTVSADSGFVPYASNAGSKTNALLIEVPQSISIVSQAEMEARGVITVNEALRYTPGIQTDEYGVEPRFDWLKIRGFDAQTFGIFRDGMRFNSLAGKLDPFELESVEVLKGPSSVLYGEIRRVG